MSLVGSGGTDTATHAKEICLSRRGKESEQWERFQRGCHGFSRKGGLAGAESFLAYLALVNIPTNIQNVCGNKESSHNFNRNPFHNGHNGCQV